MTAYRPGLDGTSSLDACKLKQNANEGCNSCATVVQVLQDLFYVLLHALCFIACFMLYTVRMKLEKAARDRKLRQARATPPPQRVT